MDGNAGMPQSETAQAKALIDLGRHGDAIPLLHRSIGRTPDDPVPRCLLALCLLNLQRSTEAEAMARSAIAVAPNAEWPHRIRSLTLRAMRKRKEALDEAQQAVRLEPELAVAHAVLGMMQLANRKFDEATRSAEDVIRLGPELVEGHALLADIALARHRWRDAETLYHRALAIEPDNWALMNNLGLALKRLGRRREAVEAFENAARLNPRAELARNNLFSNARDFLVNRPLYVALAIVSLAPIVSIRTWLRAQWDANNPWLIASLYAYVIGMLVVVFWSERQRKRTLSQTTQNFYAVQARRMVRGKGLFRFAWMMGAYLIALAGMLLTVFLGSGVFFLVALAVAIIWLVIWPRLWRRAIQPWLSTFGWG